MVEEKDPVLELEKYLDALIKIIHDARVELEEKVRKLKKYEELLG